MPSNIVIVVPAGTGIVKWGDIPAGSAPVAGFSASPTSGNIPFVCNVTSTATGTGLTYSYDWGDGSPHGVSANDTHTYSSVGNFTLTQTVTDAYLRSSSYSISIDATSSVANPTTATLSGSSTATTGVAHASRITLDEAADQAYVVAWTRSNSGTGPATSTFAIGATYVDSSDTWSAAGSGRTVDFTISPSMTRAGRPVTVTVSDAPAYTTRIDNTNLLVDVAAGTALSGTVGGSIVTPARGSVSAPKDDYVWGTIGPNADYYDVPAKAAWRVQGGDWIDQTGVRQATGSPYFSFTANTLTSGTATYTGIDVSQAVTDAFRRGKWLEFIVRSTSSRSLASQNHPTFAAPVITGTYVDGTPFSLACKACVRLTTTGSTSYTQIGAPLAQIGTENVGLGFEMPTKETTSASLAIVVSDHTATPATITGNLIDPPVNTQPILTGVSASYPLDSGISGASAGGTIVLAQNFADGTTLTDYVIPYSSTSTLDVFAKSSWDPQVYGGAADTTKLPTAFGGVSIAGTNKWFHKQDSTALVSLVSSAYSGENFQPRASGIGALRVVVPGSAAADGAVASTANAVDLMTLLPVGIIGLLGECRIRFPIRFAWRPKTLAASKMYRSAGGANAAYCVPTGKFGIGAHHLTYGSTWNGGNNNDGGENLGWSARLGYTASPADAPFAGSRWFFHSQDMRPAKVNLPFGKDGGLGSAFFPDVWYDVETLIVLNTYNDVGAIGTSASDGIAKAWVNGRLDCSHTGLNWRDGAIDYGRTPNTTYLAPFRQIGIKGLWMNFYEGGVLPPDMDLVAFIGPIAAVVT